MNFFGEQRFSSNNIAIGRSILQGKYAEAVAIIQNRNSWQKDLTEKYLQHHNSDYVGALRQLPKKLLNLMIQSYQSNLWNIVAEQIASTPSDVALQMPGFGFDERNELREIYETILANDNLSFDSFIIKSLPSLSVEAVSRKVWIQVTDMKITPRKDNTILLQFTLPKGSYATEVIKQLLIRKY